MAEQVIIDVLANFRDNMSPKIDSAESKVDKFEKSVQKTKDQLDKLGKSGSNKIPVGVDDKASSQLKKISSTIKGLAGKTFKSTMKVVDMATAPLRAIKNTLFSVKTLIAGVATGLAAQKLISGPIALADQIETANIGFETMLGSADKANAMMDKIKNFAASTPFDTSGVVSSVQQMMRAGWSAEQVMIDIEKIGNAAAAAGQGTEGVQGIVLALQQMKMAGKLNAQDMMQLTNRGVKGWEYVAKAIGKTIPETRKLSEDGLIPVDTAIQAIIDGMGEYDGMMDKMSNRTVSGLMSNLKDTFDIKIVEKWGKGLVAGASEGLGSFADWLDKIDPMLSKSGTSLEKMGEAASTWVFDKVEGAYTRLEDVLNSDEFKNAGSAFEKIQIAWDKVIAEPFESWWDSVGKVRFMKKMNGLGEGMGSGISNIFKGLLGFNAGDAANEATTIGGSFAQGFLEGFDGSGVWDALKESITNAFKDAFNILKGDGGASSWLSAALLGYGGLKIGGGLLSGYNAIGSLFGAPTAGSLLGKAGTKIGTSVYSAINAGKYSGLASNPVAYAAMGNTGLGASVAGIGLASAAGGLVAGGTLISSGKDFYSGYKSNDSKEKQAKYGSGSLKVGGVAAGAMIGSFFGPAGTLIGAGIGGAVGYFSGEKVKKDYQKEAEEAEEATRKLNIEKEKSKYSSDIMRKAFDDTTMSVEEFKNSQEYAALMVKASAQDMKEHFGEVSLSMDEIQSLAKRITLGENADAFDKFSKSSEDANASASELKSTLSGLEKLNWKAGLGFKLTSEEQTSYIETIDQYISNAKQYVEDKQYEFTASISLLMDVSDGSKGAGIIDSANGIYAGLQEQLDSLGGDLKAQVDIALEDGTITADESKIISDIQAKIQEITDKVSTAKQEASMEVLKIKYAGAQMDAESFQQLQEELMAQVEETKLSYDEALEVGIAGLKLEFPDGGAEYDAALKELTDSYNAKIEKLQVDVESFQFDALAESYGSELETALKDMDLQGTTAQKIKEAMKNATADGVDVATWDKDTAAKYLGLDSLEEESAKAITDITSNIAKTLPGKLSEALAGGTAGTTGEAMAPFADQMITTMSTGLQSADYSPIGTAIDTGVSNYLTGAASTVDGTPYAAALNTQLSAGMTQDKFSETGSKAVSSADGAVTSAFSGHSVSTTLDVNVTPSVKLTKSSTTITASGSGGSGSGTINFSVGGNANGGFISGGPQLSWLDEENQGEVVIPLGSNRRERGLELWKKTGDLLGVQQHADGGFVGRSIKNMGSGRKSGSGQNTTSHGGIQISVGGITIEVKQDGEHSGSLLDAIRNQKGEIGNEIMSIFSEALEEAFSNTPLATQ